MGRFTKGSTNCVHNSVKPNFRSWALQIGDMYQWRTKEIQIWRRKKNIQWERVFSCGFKDKAVHVIWTVSVTTCIDFFIYFTIRITPISLISVLKCFFYFFIRLAATRAFSSNINESILIVRPVVCCGCSCSHWCKTVLLLGNIYEAAFKNWNVLKKKLGIICPLVYS